MTLRARIAILVVAVAALVAAFFIARGSGDDTSTTREAQPPAATSSVPAEGAAVTATTPAAPPMPVVTVVGGRPQGGIEKLTFRQGERIRFQVRADAADTVHVHGYDIEKPVAAGHAVTFSFPGKIDGRFEVELHHSGQQIASLEVQP